MSWRELSPSKLNELKSPIIVDVRAPCEHAVENIPGSTNIPLLDDDERALIGTIYAQQGEVTARREALRIISPKVPGIVDRILELRTTGRALVVHCWRGGLRSEAVASFLSIVGIDCFRLTGGYKAWRKELLDEFKRDEYKFRAVTLQGLTGVGKTEILKRLSELGCRVLDLEGLANHRGSVFGSLGLGEQPTQKNFDAHLWQALREFGDEPVFMEAESRKIGKLSLPDFLPRRMELGGHILVEGSVEARCERIMRDYAAGSACGSPALMIETLEQAFDSLSAIKERIGTAKVNEIKSLVLSGDVREAVREMLVDYYDPLYARHIQKPEDYDLTVCGDDADSAAEEIHRWSRSLSAVPAKQ